MTGGTPTRVPGSFRDPDGFVFRRDGVVLRQVNPSFASHLEALRSSGILETELTLPVEWLGGSEGGADDHH
ncbi:hypothetical protein EON79_19395 [bacterium]|nr:MAG: hypothetical protein EON79_19395 [bacterium]